MFRNWGVQPSFIAFCKVEAALIWLNAQKERRSFVFQLTNKKNHGTIGESSVRGQLFIQAPGKLTISAMVPKNQRYGYNPSVGKINKEEILLCLKTRL